MEYVESRGLVGRHLWLGRLFDTRDGMKGVLSCGNSLSQGLEPGKGEVDGSHSE